MKKYIAAVIVLLLLVLGFDYAYLQNGWYVKLGGDKEVSTFTKTEGQKIYVDSGNGYEEFQVRGVDLGSGIPGQWSTEFACKEETYLEWFRQIKDMGANCIRIYTVHGQDFYDAFYKFNKNNPDPLYLIHGVWVAEYAQFSHEDAFDEDFIDEFEYACKRVVDVIHGKRRIINHGTTNVGGGIFFRDISPWVIGYIAGVEWEDGVVAYTNDKYAGLEGYTSYSGTYMYTTEDASPFEVMLATVGDAMIEYESSRYGDQRLFAFSNWPTTDPFDYPEDVATAFHKECKVDVEHIKTTDEFISGQFASYHFYSYFPEYFNFIDDWSDYGLNRFDYLEDGTINSYKAYVTAVNNHHSMPVVISEFGIPTSRGMAASDIYTDRNQGNTSEKDQGKALVKSFEDIIDSGCAGGCVFIWQDEWFKRTWNTMSISNLSRTPYWSNYQTNEQYFGLLSFDPGKEESVCYVDGDTSEWTEGDIIRTYESGLRLSYKYDEKFIYFLVSGEGASLENGRICIPIDTTQKTGSNYWKDGNLRFDRAVDFVIDLNGKNDSRLLVQERYEALRSTYAQDVYLYNTYEKENIPDPDSSEFVRIYYPLQDPVGLLSGGEKVGWSYYETGALTYGNANPDSPDFNNLADFCQGSGGIEIKLPWSLLNFSDPSRMEIHDDYYENYGVDFTSLKEMYAGVCFGNEESRVQLAEVQLKGWETRVTYHERLKDSYYVLQDYWVNGNDGTKEPEPVKTGRTLYLPVLMYHKFLTWDDIAAGATVDEYTIWPSELEADLKYLNDNGYTAVTCQEVIDFLEGKADLPEKPVMLSIDDGDLNVYKNAFPIIQKYGQKMTMSVIGSLIDRASNAENRSVAADDYCSWDELKEMEESGLVEITSHTYGFHVGSESGNTGATISGDPYEFGVKALSDYLKLYRSAKEGKGSFTRAMSYPYSQRDAASDELWISCGYRLLLAGSDLNEDDVYDNYITLGEGIDSKTAVLGRLVRYTGAEFAPLLAQPGGDEQ